MNSDRMPKTRQVWPTLRVKIDQPKMGSWIAIFKPQPVISMLV